MCVGRKLQPPAQEPRPAPPPSPVDPAVLAAFDAQGAAEKKKKGLASQMMRDRPLNQPLGSGTTSSRANNTLLGQ